MAALKDKYRDVEIIPIEGNLLMAVACDSCGSIGLKPHDQIKAPPYIVGKYTARVSLMEVLSIGARVVGVTANICNEPYPTAEEMICGIKSEFDDCDMKVPITISTEKNMTTAMTAMGVTVIGILDRKDLLMNNSSAGDFVYVLGIPKVGNEVVEDIGKIANTALIINLLHEMKVKEIIPVGSKGIKGELDEFLKANQFHIQWIENIQLDMEKTAGPSTAVIVISHGELKIPMDIPQNMIGKLY